MKLRAVLSFAVFASALAAFAGTASAQDCSVTVDSTDAMKFGKDVITVDKSCESFTVKLTHSGKLAENVMGHNWVLTTADNVQPVATDGMSAGLSNNYLKANDNRVIASTEIIGGGEETSVTFPVNKLDQNTVYTFFCSFPGHWTMMRGTLAVR